MYREELIKFIDNYLGVSLYKDYAPNGLQVEGSKEVFKVVTAVTASKNAIEFAIKEGANAILTHHGYFWKGEDQRIIGIKQRRLKSLLENDINLFAYHIPLDDHKTIGNNALLAEKWEIENKEKIENSLIWKGYFKGNVKDLIAKVEESLIRKVDIFNIESIIEKNGLKVLWCSGAAQSFLEEAYNNGADVYISGEVSEKTYHEAKELGMCYVSAGHYATEMFGIEELGKVIKDKFNINVLNFIENNPV